MLSHITYRSYMPALNCHSTKRRWHPQEPTPYPRTITLQLPPGGRIQGTGTCSVGSTDTDGKNGTGVCTVSPEVSKDPEPVSCAVIELLLRFLMLTIKAGKQVTGRPLH